MTDNFPRDLFTELEARQIFEALSPGFHRESPRPGRERDTYLAPDTAAHVLYRTTKRAPDCPLGVIPVESLTLPDVIGDRLYAKMNWVEDYVNERTIAYQSSFLIMSSDWCGFKNNMKHVHPIVQRGPDRCIVWSFPIPIYIDHTSTDRHAFSWSSQAELFPKIVYMSHRRMRELSVDYNRAEVPKDGKLINYIFDAARVPHWIDFTPHMYIWMVFEGVDFDRSFMAKDPITNLYMDLI